MLTSNLESNLLHYNLTVSILQSCKELQNIYCQILVMNVLVSIYNFYLILQQKFAFWAILIISSQSVITLQNKTFIPTKLFVACKITGISIFNRAFLSNF